MAQLTVRNVPEETVERLRELARDRGDSMNDLVREAIDRWLAQQRRPEDMQALLARIDAHVKDMERRHGGPLPDSTPLIREMRGPI